MTSDYFIKSKNAQAIIVIVMFLSYVAAIVGIILLLTKSDLWLVLLLILLVGLSSNIQFNGKPIHYAPLVWLFKYVVGKENLINASPNIRFKQLTERLDHMERNHGKIIGFEYLGDVYCVEDAPRTYVEEVKLPIWAGEEPSEARCTTCLNLIDQVEEEPRIRMINGAMKILPKRYT